MITITCTELKTLIINAVDESIKGSELTEVEQTREGDLELTFESETAIEEVK